MALSKVGNALDLPEGWGGVARANTPETADGYFAARSPSQNIIRRDGSHDVVAVEEPLEIRIEAFIRGRRQTRPVSITMRSPGDDRSLAVGFLYGEGIIRAPNDIENVRHCDDGANPNVVNVRLAEHVEFDFAGLQRNFYTTSSCGVCGKTSLEALEVFAQPVERIALSPSVIRSLPPALRKRQKVFEQTGAIHGAGLFTVDGDVIDVREDVGRHNALDKLVGARVLKNESLATHAICLSGRASFELMQKALMARVGVVVAVGAPSSLAVTLARSNNIALHGFVRGDSFNTYA
jgi:FdhD protein